MYDLVTNRTQIYLGWRCQMESTYHISLMLCHRKYFNSCRGTFMSLTTEIVKPNHWMIMKQILTHYPKHPAFAMLWKGFNMLGKLEINLYWQDHDQFTTEHEWKDLDLDSKWSQLNIVIKYSLFIDLLWYLIRWESANHFSVIQISS